MSGLLIVQMFLGLAIIALVLLQAKGGGLGTAFGGQSAVYHTKKGVEKLVFWTTIITACLFAVVSLINLKWL